MSELMNGQAGERRLLLGNEAIVRGALEAGVSLAATYPGTPASEIGDRFYEISRETDLIFEYSVNEKVALEVAAGAAATGLRAMASMKHVGLNVAADALITLGYVGVRGGLVIVTADDPSMFSSQNEQDNRYYARMAGLPLLEPMSPQEAKDMTRAAFALSEESGLPVLIRTTTRVNHTRGPVTLGELAPRRAQGHFVKDPFSQVMVPAVAREAHAHLLDKQAKVRARAETSDFNSITGQGPWGMVTSGVAAAYVEDAILELGLKDQVTLLKLGFTHPLPEKLIADFLGRVERVLVVEELEPFLEDGLKAIAQARGLTLPIQGKGEGLFSRLYEYQPALVRQVMAGYFGIPLEAPKPPAPGELWDKELPDRPPNLCPGCPHRAMYYAVKIALKDLGREGIFPTDIGCYTLGLLPPLSMADYLICMGSSISTAAGISRATGYRYLDEVIEILAEQAPDLRHALERAKDCGFSHVILDGKIVDTDQCREKTVSRTGRSSMCRTRGRPMISAGTSRRCFTRPGSRCGSARVLESTPKWTTPSGIRRSGTRWRPCRLRRTCRSRWRKDRRVPSDRRSAGR